MFKFTLESDLVDYLIENFSQYFNCEYMGREVRIKHLAVDIIGETDNIIALIEVKRDYINANTVKQLAKYMEQYETDKDIVGIAVAPKIDPACNSITIPENMILREINDVEYVKNPNNRITYATTVETGLVKKLKKLSELTRIPQSRLIDEAILDLLKKHEKEG